MENTMICNCKQVSISDIENMINQYIFDDILGKLGSLQKELDDIMSELMQNKEYNADPIEPFTFEELMGMNIVLINAPDLGLLIDDNSVETISGALDTALADKQIRENAVKKCYARLLDHFTWQKTAEKLVGLVK